MQMKRPLSRLAISALVLASAGCVAERVVYVEPHRPQPAPQPRPEPRPVAVRADNDPPSRVARLNFLMGSVSFRPEGVDEWAAARLNFPMRDGDYLWTDDDGRAELHVGATALRMARDTSFSILRLDDRLVQARVTRGSLELRIPSLYDRENFEIDTPSGAVVFDRVGTYRVDVDPDRDQTVVTVRRGLANVSASGQSVDVRAGESIFLTGGGQPSYDIVAADQPGEFEEWCASRDLREDRAVNAARYVGRDMIGYEDLDENGTWRTDVNYGTVWVPRVSVGWAPYHNGHWAWVEPWGWTWIDDAPWGFAPFHYGRWAMVGGGWVWVPRGPGITVIARPVYAPALVAFVGGNHFSASFSSGGTGITAWFPLGPREVYVPSYHCSPTYVQNVNIVHVSNVTNITNITNVTNVTYVNRGYVTAVPSNVMTGSGSVSRAALAVNPQAASSAQVLGTAAPLAPQRESVLGPRPLTPGRVPMPPASDRTKQVVAKTPPPPPPPSFEARQELLKANPGRPADPQALEALRRQTPTPMAAPVRTLSTASNGPVLQPARSGLTQARPITTPPANSNGPRPTPQPTPKPYQTQPPPDRPMAKPTGPASVSPTPRPRPTEATPPGLGPHPVPAHENDRPIRREEVKTDRKPLDRPEPRVEKPRPEERPAPRREEPKPKETPKAKDSHKDDAKEKPVEKERKPN